MSAGNSAEQAVEFYWRPGCGFCMMLDRRLTKAGVPMAKRNIWDDEKAAKFVRSVARGNETVPTVAIGQVTLVNPSAKQVFRALQREAPELLPEGVEVKEPGRFGRFFTRMLGGDA